MRVQYSVVYVKGDYDERSLPDPETLSETFRTKSEAERERALFSAENGIPEDHYVIVERDVSEWRLA